MAEGEIVPSPSREPAPDHLSVLGEAAVAALPATRQLTCDEARSLDRQLGVSEAALQIVHQPRTRSASAIAPQSA